MSPVELDQAPLYWKNRIMAKWQADAEYAAEQRQKAERARRRQELAAKISGARR